MAAGARNSFALRSDGTAMGCGLNYKGQLGLGDTADRDTFTVVPVLRRVVDIDVGAMHPHTVRGNLSATDPINSTKQSYYGPTWGVRNSLLDCRAEVVLCCCYLYVHV